MKKTENLLELIGNTPIKRLERISDHSGVNIWAKLENMNPSGSLKDRIALQMIEDAVMMYRRLIQEEGLFVGVSAGANVLSALEVGTSLGSGATVVTVLPDRGDRYITSEHYIT